MKRPSFQFYPGDWTANPNLRRCSFAERGIWMELMCLMHDQEEYGVLRWPLKEIAQAVGCKVSDLLDLQRKGVLKGADSGAVEPFVYVPRSGRKDGDPVTLIDAQEGPLWYSSRMVKDEHVRTIRGEGNTPKVAQKQPPKGSPKPPIGETNGATLDPRGSSSSSSIEEPNGSSPPHPPGLDVAAWDRWVAYRKGIRKAIKPASMEAAQRALCAFGDDQAAVVEQSIAAGWQGLFALKAAPANVGPVAYIRPLTAAEERVLEGTPSIASQDLLRRAAALGRVIPQTAMRTPFDVDTDAPARRLG